MKTLSGNVSPSLSQGFPGGRCGGLQQGPGEWSFTTVVLTSAVICHVVGITYQHIDRWLLAEMLGDLTGKALCGSLVLIWDFGGWASAASQMDQFLSYQVVT